MPELPPLYGLVCCGGRSSRMGRDKANIIYHGKPQMLHVYELLQAVCGRVYISCNAVQAAEIPAAYARIVDSDNYTDIGPMHGLLSAWEQHPQASWMMIGCDYPLLQPEDLAQLARARRADCDAACFYKDGEEPLLAVYEQRMRARLFDAAAGGSYSLRKLLQQADATQIVPRDASRIRSIDTPEAMQQLLLQLAAKQG